MRAVWRLWRTASFLWGVTHKQRAAPLGAAPNCLLKLMRPFLGSYSTTWISTHPTIVTLTTDTRGAAQIASTFIRAGSQIPRSREATVNPLPLKAHTLSFLSPFEVH